MDYDNNIRTNGIIMFLFSLIPGCAHMYLGLMKRGIQILAPFFLCVFIALWTNMLEFVLAPAAIVIYAFSFFDGYNCLRNIKAGKKVLDEPIIEGLNFNKLIEGRGYIIGIILVVLGAFALIDSLASALRFNEYAYRIFRYFREFTPAAILLILGFIFMVKGRKNTKNNKEEDVQIAE